MSKDKKSSTSSQAKGPIPQHKRMAMGGALEKGSKLASPFKAKKGK